MTGGSAHPRPWRVRIVIGVVALAVAVTGCRGEPDPRDELADAVRATADTSVIFELGARADRGAIGDGGDGAADAARFLGEAAITGARDPDEALRLSVSIGADTPLLEVVSDPAGTLSLRTGLGSLLGVDDRDPAEQLDPLLADLGVDEAGRRALAVSFAGGWVELSDVDDLRTLLDRGADATDPEGAVTERGEPLTLDGVLDAVTVLEARDAGDVRRLDVQVDVGVLAEAIGLATDDAAGDRPGTVVLRDGLLQEVRVELSGSEEELDDGDADAVGGDIELVLTVTPVAEGRAVLLPDPDASLRAEELFELVEQLQAVPGLPG